MSDTPRTDKAAYYMGRSGADKDIARWCDLLNESRQLERELAAVTKERDLLQCVNNDIRRIADERNKAESELAQARAEIDSLMDERASLLKALEHQQFEWSSKCSELHQRLQSFRHANQRLVTATDSLWDLAYGWQCEYSSRLELPEYVKIMTEAKAAIDAAKEVQQ